MSSPIKSILNKVSNNLSLMLGFKMEDKLVKNWSIRFKNSNWDRENKRDRKK